MPAGDPPDPDDAAERAAVAEHYAAPPEPCPWQPGDLEPLRDGLLAGWRASRSGRLSALAQRLEAARPLQVWGVSEVAWRAWQMAAQEVVGLPSAAWSAWRATVGTEMGAGPSPGAVHR